MLVVGVVSVNVSRVRGDSWSGWDVGVLKSGEEVKRRGRYASQKLSLVFLYAAVGGARSQGNDCFVQRLLVRVVVLHPSVTLNGPTTT
jgi:hypothetical protein